MTKVHADSPRLTVTRSANSGSTYSTQSTEQTAAPPQGLVELGHRFGSFAIALSQASSSVERPDSLNAKRADLLGNAPPGFQSKSQAVQLTKIADGALNETNIRWAKNEKKYSIHIPYDNAHVTLFDSNPTKFTSKETCPRATEFDFNNFHVTLRGQHYFFSADGKFLPNGIMVAGRKMKGMGICDENAQSVANQFLTDFVNPPHRMRQDGNALAVASSSSLPDAAGSANIEAEVAAYRTRRNQIRHSRASCPQNFFSGPSVSAPPQNNAKPASPWNHISISSSPIKRKREEREKKLPKAESSDRPSVKRTRIESPPVEKQPKEEKQEQRGDSALHWISGYGSD